MPVNSPSPLSSRLATVFDFLPALARRCLGARACRKQDINVIAGAPGVFTVSCLEGLGEEDNVEQRIAQLREVSGGYALFWKRRCSGRWTAYSGEDNRPFVGTIRECFAEIARDPHGRYWS